MANTDIIGASLREFTAPGSMGVVTDTWYAGCYWPKLDKPVALFAEGSSGIKVQGPPTPRNVVFPADTVFEAVCLDALYPAEQAVKAMSQSRAGLVNLSPAECAAWVVAYNDAKARIMAANLGASMASVTAERFCLRERVARDEYVADLSAVEAGDLIDGNVTEQALRDAKTFRHTETGVVRVR